MGLKTEATVVSSNSTKLTIIGDSFRLRVDAGTPDAIARTLTKGKNEGKEIHELHYPAIEGFIVSGVITQSEYPSAEMTLVDGEDSYTLQFPLESRKLFDLIKRLPNINTDRMVEIALVESKKKSKTGNPMYNLQVTQDGKPVYDHYTKWSQDEAGKNVCTCLHGMPEAVHGRKGWSFDDQEEFLLVQFEDQFDTLKVAKVFEAEEDDDNVPF